MFKGMSYTPWSSDGALSTGARQSLADLRSLGADTVALNVFGFQDTARSTAIALDDPSRHGISLSAARQVMRDIRAAGMAVVLKPQVDVRDGTWRGAIDPRRGADRAAWFGQYAAFVSAWATAARDEGAVGFCVGTEMNAVQRHDAEWRRVIAGVRERFGGWLTYGANWDAYRSVPFWDALDAVGIDAYFPVARGDVPMPAELRGAWDDVARSIGAWRASRGLDAPVLFTEAGYRSLAGAARRPWVFGTGGAVDLRAQADAYDALLSVMMRQAWFGGAFFWNWLPDPAAGGGRDADFTPQNKPAAAVLASYYRPAPPGRPAGDWA